MSFYFLGVRSFRDDLRDDMNISDSKGSVFYSILIPVFCCCGIVVNILSLMVLNRRELRGSVYTYLSVLASVDLSLSIVILFCVICNGTIRISEMAVFDILIGLPLGGALSTLGVLAIVSLTLDRVMYLWNPVQCTKPKFCSQWVAKRLMIVCVIISILFNIPYCFIYTWDIEETTLNTTPFFYSTFYKIFNWITLIIFAVIPAIILIFGNGFLIMSLRKASRISRSYNKCITRNRKRRDRNNLTVTLVAIIVFFLITNIPENLVSRATVVNLLFQGDQNKASNNLLENFRQVYSVIAAVDVNANFIFYYTFCPAFCKVLRNIFRRKKRKPTSKTVQVNVFVLNAEATNSQKISSFDNNIDTRLKSKVLKLSRKSIESVFSSNRCERKKELLNLEELNRQNENGGINGEYVEMMIPPFSTILEESSSYYRNLDNNNNKDC